ncbi:predicted protein [Lichtheimia corymbifera JMRC:FSU:9682]|uniref:Nuclear pore complex protein n=1 Tax=Lichtheimia corymbifera JMRC:FSU:9682 TaxID=1263082 RepID=A0A068SCJ0_9FUNG|nr:predicted protein [Lichtheimia corymbifera JMRC:FSU:9682]
MNLPDEIFINANNDLDRAIAEVVDLTHDGIDNKKLVTCIKDLVELRIDHLHSIQGRKAANTAQEELKFLTREKWIWTLLELMIRLRESRTSPLYQYAQMTAYIEQLIAHHGVSSEMDMHDDIEDEIEELVRSNRFLSGFIGSRKRRHSQTLDEPETTYQRLFRALRCGDMQKACDINKQLEPQTWRTGLIMRYIEQRKKALDGKHVEWLDEQRKTWSWLYDQKESKDKLGQYETAILGALCGRTERVLPICRGWEDVIWAFYNCRIHQAEEAQASTNEINGTTPNLLLVEKEYSDIASKKKHGLQDGYLQLFATLTLSILHGKLQEGISYCCSLLLDPKMPSNLRIRPGSWMWPYALRLLSALILYSRIFYSQPSDSMTDEILGHYAKHNVTKPNFKPKLLALYASFTPQSVQVPVVSDFLAANFWDNEERKLLFDMGKQYGLDMVSILRQTWKRTLHDFMDERSIIHKPPRGIWLHDDEDDSDPDDDPHGHSIQQLPFGVKRCLMQFAWLLMDDHLYFDAITAANKLGNHFLDTKQHKAAAKLISSIPGSVIDMAILQADCNVDLPAPICEFEKLCTRIGKP